MPYEPTSGTHVPIWVIAYPTLPANLMFVQLTIEAHSKK